MGNSTNDSQVYVFDSRVQSCEKWFTAFKLVFMHKWLACTNQSLSILFFLGWYFRLTLYWWGLSSEEKREYTDILTEELEVFCSEPAIEALHNSWSQWWIVSLGELLSDYNQAVAEGFSKHLLKVDTAPLDIVCIVGELHWLELEAIEPKDEDL